MDAPRFKVGQRVMFYNDKGEKHCGTVGWTGKDTRTRSFACTLVGIHTDKAVYKSDYEHSRPGLDRLMSARKRHALFLPEARVEEIRKAGGSESSPRPARSDTAQEIADVLNMSEDLLLKQQAEAFKEVEKEAAVEAMKAAEQSIDFNKQQAYYEKLRAESAAKGQRKGDQNEIDSPAISQQQENLRQFEAQKRAQNSNNAGDGLGEHMSDVKYPSAGRRPSSHIYDEPEQFLDAGRGGAGGPAPYDPRFSQHRKIHQQQHDRPAHKQVVPYDQGVGGQPGDRRQPSHGKIQETSFGQEPSTQGYPPHNAGAGHNLGYQQDRQEQYMLQDFPPSQNQTGTGHDSRSNLPGENRDFSQAPVSQSSQELPPGAQGQSAVPYDPRWSPCSAHPAQDLWDPHDQDTGKPEHHEERKPNDVISMGVTKYPCADHPHAPSRSQSNPLVAERGTLQVGSPVQVPATDGSIKYGTIRWMGHVPNTPGEIAGIEMDDDIEGCTDCAFQATGQQFFTCSPGKGLYYPLKNLVVVDGCHLKQLYLQLKRDSHQRITELRRENVSLTELQVESQQRINGLTNTLLLSQPFYSKAELNTVSRAEIEKLSKKKIGRGAWGKVYSARFQGEDVAIKIAHRAILDQSTVNMLKREIQIMSSVQHPNLVRFIAAVMDDAVERKVDMPIIISELMDMNLRAAYKAKDLSSQLLSIFRDVAYALQYLHQHREPIIHRDISAPNVLLKSLPGGSYRAKVSDFGSANLVKNSTTAGAGAIIYSAPEMFPSEGIAARRQLPKQSPKVDVYSYGILLLEVIAKEMPSQDTSYDLLQKVKGQWNTMYALIVDCTKPSPSDRPTMADILNKLNRADMIAGAQKQDFPSGQNQSILPAGQVSQGPKIEQSSEFKLPGKNHGVRQAFLPQGHPPGADGQGAVPAAGSTGPPAGEDLSHGLGVGSLIQIPGADGHSVKYGTIKWIGLVPKAQGKVAGIELEEPMEGCTDGTFQGTGQQFFNCPQGMGLYYPLKNLVPDHRWAPQVAADGNPLRHVRSEEMLDTRIPDTLEMYIGDERGIQGHQNSCYLDATLFGLFALSTEFDAMFLHTNSDISRTLWRNIVNPLRKNGVVKYECVMRLREQLDQLCQMKGISQDEKDPEEFLNLMFKHALHVPPFLSIRRPFGVEKEYFVQLFSEEDGSKEPPSIGNLLEKMYLEQHISFTEVPSKLLIQVPCFGKKFQTFQKIIPVKTINIASIVDVQGKCSSCGEGNARHYCPDCKPEFSDPTYCDRCLERAHARRPNHDRVGLTREAFHIKTMADLELLSVICIETSHYVCFTRQEDRWIFFDSMANRVYDKYDIPKVDECTRDLNNWVYPPGGDISRLLNTPPRELPEYVRRFTQDIYMYVYIQPDMSMYA